MTAVCMWPAATGNNDFAPCSLVDIGNAHTTAMRTAGSRSDMTGKVRSYCLVYRVRRCCGHLLLFVVINITARRSSDVQLLLTMPLLMIMALVIGNFALLSPNDAYRPAESLGDTFVRWTPCDSTATSSADGVSHFDTGYLKLSENLSSRDRRISKSSWVYV